MLPDVTDGAVLDVAHGRCSIAHGDIPVRLELQHGQSRAEKAALVGSVRLGGDAEGIRIAEVGDHCLELSIAVGDVIALPLHVNYLAHHANRLLDVSRPVGARLEPASVFRCVVILLDRLKEVFHPVLFAEPDDIAYAIEVLIHDHGLKSDHVGQAVLRAHSLERADRSRGFLEEIVATTYPRMSLTDAIERYRDAPGSGESQFLDLRLIVPVTMRQDLEKQSEPVTMVDQLRGKGFKQRFSTTKDHLHGPEPPSEVCECLFPLFRCRGVFLASVLPDVAVDATRIAELGKEKDGRRGAATRGKAAAREVPQAVVGRLVQPTIEVIPRRHDYSLP